MLLIKCSCGCHFTVKSDAAKTNSKRFVCQNCGKNFYYAQYNGVGESFEELTKTGFEVFSIPDDSEFSYHCKL